MTPLARCGILVTRRDKWRIKWHIWRGNNLAAQKIILGYFGPQSHVVGESDA